MNIVYSNLKRIITLMPGDYYVSDTEVIITTILGSCVSVCLYDPMNCIVGMNHFLLSSMRIPKTLPLSLTRGGRYGVNAMELIINGMLKLGAKRENFHAKVFGGASLFSGDSGTDNFNCVGEVNSRFVLEFLQNEGIKLVASDLGGDRGRVIRFYSKSFSVQQRRIKKTVPDLIIREKRFWEQEAVKKHPEPELWE
jgi:chemotaxis protein CheD